MSFLEIIRMTAGFALLLLSVCVFVFEVIGIFKMDFCLNRMHSAAMGDTLGLAFGIFGLMLICGFNFTTLKMLLVLIFLWCTSPVASHLIAMMVYRTAGDLSDHAQTITDSEEPKQ